MIYPLLYKFGRYLTSRISLKSAYRIAEWIACLKYAFSFRDKSAIRKNLSVILPGNPPKRAINACIKNIYVNFGKYLVDFFRISSMDRIYIERHVRFVNEDHLKRALEKGRGVICLSAHIGNWELAGAALALKGYPVSAVALDHNHDKVNEFFICQRQSTGMAVISMEKRLRECFCVIRDKRILAILGDRDFTGSGEKVSVFNREAILPKGPAIFQIKTKCLIVPTFLIRNTDDTFTMYFEEEIDLSLTPGNREDVKAVMNQYIPAMEKYIRKYPDQWCVFRSIWTQR